MIPDQHCGDLELLEPDFSRVRKFRTSTKYFRVFRLTRKAAKYLHVHAQLSWVAYNFGSQTWSASDNRSYKLHAAV